MPIKPSSSEENVPKTKLGRLSSEDPGENVCAVCKLAIEDQVIACKNEECTVCIYCTNENFRAFKFNCPNCERSWDDKEIEVFQAISKEIYECVRRTCLFGEDPRAMDSHDSWARTLRK